MNRNTFAWFIILPILGCGEDVKQDDTTTKAQTNTKQDRPASKQVFPTWPDDVSPWETPTRLAIYAAQNRNGAKEIASSLNEVATTLIETGETKKALDVLDQALEVIATIADQRERQYELVNTAEAIARAGSFDKSLVVLGKVDEQLRDIRKPAWVRVLVESEQFDRAIEMARTLDSDYDRPNAFRYIASGLAEVGNAEQATALVSSLRGIDSAVFALQIEAHASARVGQKSRARELLRKAELQAKQIDEPAKRTETLIRNAFVYLFKLKDRERALLALRDARNSAMTVDRMAYRVHLLTLIGRLLIEAGDEDQSLLVLTYVRHQVQGVEKEVGIESIQSLTAHALADAGHYEEAFECAGDIASVGFQARARSDIALSQAQAGEIQQSLENLRQMFDWAKSIESSDEKMGVLYRLAISLATNQVVKEIKGNPDGIVAPVYEMKTQFTLEETELVKLVFEEIRRSQ